MATLTATANSAGGYVALSLAGAVNGQEYTVTRTGSGGSASRVRNGDPAPIIGTSWVSNDYEAPLDEALAYTATLVTTPFTAVAAAPVTLAASGGLPWLTHPGKPSLNMLVLPADFVLGSRPSRATVLPVLGRSRPVGQSLRRGGYEGELPLRLAGQSELDALDAILDDGTPLLLRAPAGWIGYGYRYLQIGDATVERMTRTATDGRFLATLAYIEVERPGGTAEGGAGFRWIDVMDAYADWDALMAGKDTWLDVLNGV